MATQQDVDVCIIGGGPGGGVVAKELASHGMSVVILETGPRYRPKTDFINDEAEMTKLMWNDPRTLAGKHPIFPLGGKGVGGASLVWTGVSYRFHSTDFCTYSTDGVGRDWPITHDELKPYYEKVEGDFGIAGLGQPDCDNLSPRYPMPPHPPNTVGILFERGCKALGLEAIPGSMAINSVPYDGRDACVYCGFCVQGCAINAKASSLNTYVPKAEQHGARVLPNCTAYRIELDGQERARRVLYFDHRGNEQAIAARVVVVAGGAVETPRLLLESECAQFPDGLANRSGMVGKNFMAHTLQFVHGSFPQPIDTYRGFNLGHCCYIGECYTQPGKDYVRGFVLESSFSPPVGLALNSGCGWGQEFKDFFDKFLHIGGIFGVGESLPNDRNTVTLDADYQDQHGRAVPRITHEWHENDVKLIGAARERSQAILEAAGASEIYLGGLRGAHFMGTCRIGTSPDDSVVTQYCQSHDIANLFVCDTSIFVTGGNANITLTAMAIIQRGAEYLRELMRAGDL
jgi:choline dehydrogenase-like flavoprotein